MKFTHTILTAFALLGGSLMAAEKPNIVVILADDLGFSDLGCYGSEIETPNLDKLAAGGLRFSQFYNTAKCHSSRVSLLTGRWCMQAGNESMVKAVTIPEVLKPQGYFTAISGKWHLDKMPEDYGFDRFFGHLSGLTNYFKGDKTFRLGGKPYAVPSENFYTTIANVDHAIDFLGEARAAKKPWFLYLPFNAPHSPLQPLEVDYKKYLGRYDVGWDSIQAARAAKQKSIGLLPATTEIAPRPDHIPAWGSLTPEWKQWEAQRMAAYAGLIDRLDREIGRLVANLTAAGELENTLILFVSDNGACPYDRGGKPKPGPEPFQAESKRSDSTGWAWARNAPFRFYKQNQYEGGITTPGIIHWPAGLKTKPGAITSQPVHLVDVLPTLAEITESVVPMTFPGREPTPLAGVSIAPILAGKTMESRPPIHLLYNQDRGLRDGDWKLVSFQSEPWELYQMTTDRTELHDVAAKNPTILKRMVEQWHDMSANVLMVPEGQNNPVATEVSGKIHKEWSKYSASANGRDGKNKANRKKKNKDVPTE